MWGCARDLDEGCREDGGQKGVKRHEGVMGMLPEGKGTRGNKTHVGTYRRKAKALAK